MLERGDNKEYLPIEGLAAFNDATAKLLLGGDNALLKEVGSRQKGVGWGDVAAAHWGGLSAVPPSTCSSPRHLVPHNRLPSA